MKKKKESKFPAKLSLILQASKVKVFSYPTQTLTGMLAISELAPTFYLPFLFLNIVYQYAGNWMSN